jgi:hypothetical protein
MRKIFKQTTTGGMVAATGFCGNTDSISHFLHTMHHTDKLLPQHIRRDLMNLKWPIKNTTNEFYGLGAMFNATSDFVLAGHGGGYPGFTSRTQALLGSDYVFSTIANSNESFGVNPLRTMAEIIRKIEAVFEPAEAAAAIVSKPMMNNWGVSLYVVGKEKALLLPLGGWLPVGDSIVLNRRKDGFNIQEQIIRTVKFASYTSYPIEDYIKRDKKRFVGN